MDYQGSSKQEVPFRLPKPDAKPDPVQIFKGQFMPVKGRTLQTEYREEYPDKNYNNVKCFKTETTKH